MTLAARQHGVVARTQLLNVGVSAQTLDRRLKAKRLRPLHRGVYLVGPLVVPRAQAMAAVLACGDAAVVSHESAATLWGLTAVRAEVSAEVVVSIVRGDRRRPGIRVHRALTLRPDEVTTMDRIPITTPARTLLDLANAVPRRQVERALAQALAGRITHRTELIRIVERHARRPGARELRALLESGQPAFTRSEAEERFLALIRKAQLPLPETNVVVCGHEVDFFWRVERFVTEIDGFTFHASPAKFESDRRRDAMLAASGIRVIRVTWRQLQEEREALLVRLAQALARAAPQ